MQIHDEARYGQAKGLEALIKTGVNVNIRDDVGQTPLHLAAANGFLKCVEILLQNKANIDLPDMFGSTPLLHAVERNQFLIVKYLLDHGADIEGDNGENCLLLASKNGYIEIAVLLLERGVNVNCEDFDGLTPLCNVVCEGNISMAKILLEKGADVNQSNIDGETPLFCAHSMMDRLKKIAELLKQHGAKEKAPPYSSKGQ